MALNKDQEYVDLQLKRLIQSYTGGICLIDGVAGVGKRLSFNYPVLTPTGYVRNGDLKVGDYVIGKNGKPTKVLGVYDSEKYLEFYKLTFSDNTTAECCVDHLWSVATPKLLENGKWKTISLRDMLPKIQEGRKSKKHTFHYAIPLVEPVEFEEKDLLVDPYTLGFLLGDGCFRTRNQVQVSHLLSDSEEILSLIQGKYKKPSFYQCDPNSASPNTARFTFNSDLKNDIIALGLDGLYSHEKYVPKEYLYGSISQRLSLLQGLMDSDGTVDFFSPTRAKFRFSNGSIRLVQDVIFLIQSLGGTATYHQQERKGSIEYNVNIVLDLPLFRLKRKLEKQQAHKPSLRKIKKIVSAEFIGNLPGRCIKVEAEDNLYVIDQFIVTHNTYTISHTLDTCGASSSEICVCAPTDKALEVVSQNLEKYPAKTIHSLLGYYPSADHNGKMWLNAVLDKEIPYRVVVLDEAYCTPNIILQAMWERRDILWICLGDVGQLKAIGDSVSLLTEIDLLFQYELTIQERSKSTCFPIIQAIREQGTDFVPKFIRSNIFEQNFFQDLEEGKDATYLAFHNKVINEMARKARLYLYDQAEDIPIVGERIRMKMLTDFEGKKVIHSNAIVQVKEVDEDGIIVNYRGNPVFAPFLRYEGNTIKKHSPDHLSLVEIALNTARDKTGKTRKEAAKDWNKFYNIQNSYLRWSFPGVSTVHCLPENTLVKTVGGFKEIKDLEVGIDQVYTSDQSIQTVISKWDEGVKETKKVKTKFGYSIEATEEHRFLVASKDSYPVYKKVKDMTTEDYLILDRNAIDFPEINLSELDMWRIGYLLGNGGLTSSSITVTCHKGHEYLLDYFKDTRRTFRGNRAQIQCAVEEKNFCENVGLNMVKSPEKDIPLYLLNSSHLQRMNLLAGLIDSDGTINKEKGVVFSTTSNKLMKKFRFLCLSLGITTSMFESKDRIDCFDNAKDIFIVSLSMTDSNKFKDLPLKHKDKVKQLKSFCSKTVKVQRVGRPPFRNKFGKDISESKESLKLDRKTKQHISNLKCSSDNITQNLLSKLPTSAITDFLVKTDYLYLQITSIEDSNPQKVYDITVEGTHSFIADGFVSSNSFQGSTTDLAYVNWGDLKFCHTDPNIQYSAASRARDYVYFCK